MLKLLAFVLGVVGFGLSAAVAEDMSEELRGILEDCGQGNADACYHAALMYEHGKSDQSRALQLYEQACDLGDGVPCFQLGWRYENGWGTREDDALALDFYSKSCDYGNQYGCERHKLMTKPKPVP